MTVGASLPVNPFKFDSESAKSVNTTEHIYRHGQNSKSKRLETSRVDTHQKPINGFKAVCASTPCLAASGSYCSIYTLTVAPAEPVPCAEDR